MEESGVKRITKTHNKDGYLVVMTQFYLFKYKSGAYQCGVFDRDGHLVHVYESPTDRLPEGELGIGINEDWLVEKCFDRMEQQGIM